MPIIIILFAIGTGLFIATAIPESVICRITDRIQICLLNILLNMRAENYIKKERAENYIKKERAEKYIKKVLDNIEAAG